MIDIFFISYNESNADENFARLRDIAPRAIRVEGIKGIHQAHRHCAALATTDHFFVVDADNWVLDDFRFEPPSEMQSDAVYVWRCRNAVNGLVYGYGAIKAFPTDKARQIPVHTVDMTTSVSTNYKIVNVLASETRFNTSPFETWKSAFRECVKLSSRVIHRQVDDETQRRLEIWMGYAEDVPHAQWCLIGATEGKAFGEAFRDEPEKLAVINDFDQLRSMWEATHGNR